MTFLSDLAVGQEACVAEVTGERSFVRRLLSLGLAPGCQVRVIRFAPLGDPMQVQVGALQLAIRKEEARRVRLAP
jgi:Fe2+ transport system protein FeoA